MKEDCVYFFLCFFSATMCGSGMLIEYNTINAKTKIPIAKNNAGLASEIVAFATSPIK